MNRVALFINSPYMGGAERSILSQIALIKSDADITIFIPKLDKNIDQQMNFKAIGITNKIIYYKYPGALFSHSREDGVKFIKLLLTPFFFVKAFLNLRKVFSPNQFDILWCNGNKVATLISIYAWLGGFKKRLYWHFRDYPSRQRPYSYIWKIINECKKFDISAIANSYSVKNEIVKCMPNIKTSVVYNPTGVEFKKLSRQEKDTIGVVSMMAPWKGVHQVLYLAKLFSEELKEIGIKKICIYGGDIYKTSGQHSSYYQSLLEYKNSNKLEMISFEGLKELDEIYSNIDYLFHTSVRPEPFGRVLLEAFQAQIPVFSTCLGGAGELVQDGITGYEIYPHDYAQWIEKMKIQLENNNQQIIECAYKKYLNIESSVKEDIKDLLVGL